MLVNIGCDSTGVLTESALPQSEESRLIAHMPSVVAGRIAFKDFDEFRSFMEHIVNQSDAHLDSIERDQFCILKVGYRETL